MSEPLVLVILLGANADPTTDAVMTAARRALGPEAVVVADMSSSQSDADALAIGARVHARAVARVSWADGGRQVARLHVHVMPANEWTDDEVRFLPQDAASERGRMIGYALASMVQRLERERTEEPPRDAAVTVKASGAPLVAPRDTAPAASPAARTLAEAPDTARIDREAAVTNRELAPGVEVFAHSSGVLGGGATSIGGAAGARWWGSTRLGLRGAAGARAGAISAANVTTTTLFASAGPSYRIPIGSTLELGARVDFIVLHHSATRRETRETTHARWLGAVGAMIEGSWALGPHAGVIAAAGAELAFGTTMVSVGGTPTADIPRARALAELGVRFRF